jgi:hypothetical protein
MLAHENKMGYVLEYVWHPAKTNLNMTVSQKWIAVSLS